jgi:7-carboxy-7-deazaguanine synthase (Cx14CxxC type)
MTYSVKEIYYTLQGEGAQTGRAAVFCRFAGCNLWSGKEEDRATAVCKFCDTEFVGTDGPGGGKFETAQLLARAVADCWPLSLPEISSPETSSPEVSLPETSRSAGSRLVVCTGGEPLLQVDAALITALHDEGFEIAVETNGTQAPPAGLDWICVSPKAHAQLVTTGGNELKLVYPQADALPQAFEHLGFDHFFLQPMDGANVADNTRRAIEYCKQNPRWRLSLQTHKLLGIA